MRPSPYMMYLRKQYKVATEMQMIKLVQEKENLQKHRLEMLKAMPPNGLDLSSSKVMENLPLIVAGISSEDCYLQLKATNFLRQMLTIKVCPPINVVVQYGVVPRVVKFLSRDDFPELQFEAAWVLTNIASGTSEYTKIIVESGVVPIFIRLLSSPSVEVREQAVWALGNVAGDSPKYRDLVLNHNAMMNLLYQFNAHTTLSMLRNATWTLSNLCRGKPQLSFEQIKPALPVLERLLHSTDEEVLRDACCALSYLYSNSNDNIHAFLNARVVPRLIELLSHSLSSVLIPALRTIGNIVTADDDHTQTVLDHQVLPHLLNLLTNTYEKIIKKETCWTISNSTTKNSTQEIQTMIEEGIIQSVVWVLQTIVFKVKKEAASVISNATCSGTHDQIRFMVKQGCIKPISDLLTCPDQRIITVCLEALENILTVGESEKNSGHTGDSNIYVSMIEEAEGLEKIENLQSHDNNDIYQKAAKILETFWAEDNNEEGNDENHGFQFRSGGESDTLMVPPSELMKNDRVKILSGQYRGCVGKLIGIDGSEGIVKIEDTLDVRIVDMAILSKLVQQ